MTTTPTVPMTTAEMTTAQAPAMPIRATPMPGVLLPFHVGPDPDGHMWAMFSYDAYRADPWAWPKALTIGGRTYIHRGYNSDSRTVHYSQSRPHEQLAIVAPTAGRTHP